MSRHEIKRHFCLSVDTKERVNVTIHFQNLMFLCFAVGQSLSLVWLFVTPWTAPRQAPLFFTLPWSLLRSCPQRLEKMHGPTENSKVKVLSPSGHHQGDSMLVKEVCKERGSWSHFSSDKLHLAGTGRLCICSWETVGHLGYFVQTCQSSKSMKIYFGTDRKTQWSGLESTVYYPCIYSLNSSYCCASFIWKALWSDTVRNTVIKKTNLISERTIWTPASSLSLANLPSLGHFMKTN